MQRLFPFATGSVIGAALLLLACVKDGAPEATSETRAKATPRSVSPGAASSESVLQELPQGEVDAGICGCKVCAPVLGPDACEKDEDCVPETACHARACVARAKAKPRDPGQQCTMNIDCRSADVNRCGCVQKHCALGVSR